MHLIREYLYGFYEIIGIWYANLKLRFGIFFLFCIFFFACFGCLFFFLFKKNVVSVDTVLTYCTVSFVASVKARRRRVLLLCDRVSPCGHRRTP